MAQDILDLTILNESSELKSSRLTGFMGMLNFVIIDAVDSGNILVIIANLHRDLKVPKTHRLNKTR